MRRWPFRRDKPNRTEKSEEQILAPPASEALEALIKRFRRTVRAHNRRGCLANCSLATLIGICGLICLIAFASVAAHSIEPPPLSEFLWNGYTQFGLLLILLVFGL